MTNGLFVPGWCPAAPDVQPTGTGAGRGSVQCATARCGEPRFGALGRGKGRRLSLCSIHGPVAAARDLVDPPSARRLAATLRLSGADRRLLGPARTAVRPGRSSTSWSASSVTAVFSILALLLSRAVATTTRLRRPGRRRSRRPCARGREPRPPRRTRDRPRDAVRWLSESGELVDHPDHCNAAPDSRRAATPADCGLFVGAPPPFTLSSGTAEGARGAPPS